MKKSILSADVPTYPERFPLNLFPTALILAAMSIWLGSKGPLMAAILASLALVGRSIGLRLYTTKGQLVPMATARVTQIGPFTICHAHHVKGQNWAFHEFNFQGKRFCAGCYGVATGTLIGLMMPLLYFFCIPNDSFYLGVTLISPICFAPTMLRCMGWVQARAISRFLSYSLLPVGSWIILVQLDRWFESVFINLIALIFIVVAWFAGGKYKTIRH